MNGSDPISAGTLPDGGLWFSRGMELALLDKFGQMRTGFRANPSWSSSQVWIEQDEGRAYVAHQGDGGVAWGELSSGLVPPATLVRVQHGLDYLYATDVPGAGSDQYLVGSGSGQQHLGRISRGGDLQWAVGLNFQGVLQTGTSAGLVAHGISGTGQPMPLARISQYGELVYGRQLLAPSATAYMSAWLAGDERTLNVRIQEFSSPGAPLVLARIDTLTGTVSGAFELKAPSGWTASNWSVANLDDGGWLVANNTRPNPPIYSFDSDVGAGLMLTRVSAGGSVVWSREVRLAGDGEAPGIRTPTIVPQSGSFSFSQGGALAVRWTGYPDAEFRGSASFPTVNYGALMQGTTVVRLTDGSVMTRRDWSPNGAMRVPDGTQDLVLLDSYGDGPLQLTRVRSNGSMLWSAMTQDEYLGPYQDTFQGSNNTRILAYRGVSAPVGGDAWLWDLLELPAQPSGLQAKVLGSKSPLTLVSPWGHVPGANGALFSWGESYRWGPSTPVLARVDSVGVPTDPCLGESTALLSAPDPGSPYLMISGNAQPPVVTTTSLTLQSASLTIPASFQVTTGTATYTPRSFQVSGICD